VLANSLSSEVVSDFGGGQGARSADIGRNLSATSNAGRRQKRREIAGMEFANMP
jgi:hypothetical protein